MKPLVVHPCDKMFIPMIQSWVGRATFLWEAIFGLITICATAGFFVENSTPVLLAFEWITVVVFFVMRFVVLNWYPAINDKTKDEDEANEIRLQRCGDQKHLTGAMIAHFILAVVLSIWLGNRGTAHPVPDFNEIPLVLDPIAWSDFVMIKLFHIISLGITAISLSMFWETIPAYLFALTSTTEESNALIEQQMNGVTTDKATVVNQGETGLQSRHMTKNFFGHKSNH